MAPFSGSSFRDNDGQRSRNYGSKYASSYYKNKYHSSWSLGFSYGYGYGGPYYGSSFGLSLGYHSRHWGLGLGYNWGYPSYHYPYYSRYHWRNRYCDPCCGYFSYDASNWGWQPCYPHYGLSLSYSGAFRSSTHSLIALGVYGAALGVSLAYADSYPGYYYAPSYVYYNAPCTGLRAHASYAWRHGCRYRTYTPWCGYHYYRVRGRVYNCYRPYYYAYPVVYGAYSTSNYGYDREVVEYVDDAYGDGYRDGYRDSTEDASPYSDSRARTPYEAEPEPAERAFTGNYDELVERAASAFRTGDYDASVAYFKDATVNRPLDPAAKLGLGHASFAAARYSLAAFSLRRALALDPKLIEADIDPRSRYDDPAIFDHQMDLLARDADRDDPEGDKRFLLGYMRYYSGDYRGAAGVLEGLMRATPDDEQAARLYEASLRGLGEEKGK